MTTQDNKGFPEKGSVVRPFSAKKSVALLIIDSSKTMMHSYSSDSLLNPKNLLHFKHIRRCYIAATGGCYSGIVIAFYGVPPYLAIVE